MCIIYSILVFNSLYQYQLLYKEVVTQQRYCNNKLNTLSSTVINYKRFSYDRDNQYISTNELF